MPAAGVTRGRSGYKGRVNDLDPQVDPSGAQAHPAPPSYMPLSGLAVTSFVLSILLGLVALVGIWASELVPILLGVFAVLTIRTNGKRGRLLAIFAIFIAFGFGACSFMMHSSGMEAFSKIPESVLTALSADEADAGKDEELRKWAWPEGLEKNPQMLEQWRANYAKAAAAFGPWQDKLDLGVPWLGFSVLFFPPSDIEEIGGTEPMPEWTPGCVLWVPAVFEKGIVHMAVVMQDGTVAGQQALKEFKPDEALPIIGDVRFFRPKTGDGAK